MISSTQLHSNFSLPTQAINPILQIARDCIQTVQTVVEEHEVRIIGGSARTILDHIYQKKPLSFRDLDLGVVMGKCTSKEEALSIANAITDQLTNVYKCDGPEARQRTPKEMPLKDSSFFSVGTGFFLHRNCNKIPLVDITLFDHQEDLEILNGLLEQDNICIVLNKKRSFDQFLVAARSMPFEQLMNNGWVHQPANAYQDWMQNKLVISNWDDLNRRPHLQVLRLVRSLNTKGLLKFLITPGNLERSDLHKQWKDLNQLLTSNQTMDYGMQARLFNRCLQDNAAALEIKALCQVGLFDRWLPHLKTAIDWLSVDEIEQLLVNLAQSGPEEKLKALTKKLPLFQKLHTLYYASGGSDLPEKSIQSVWNCLDNAFKEFGPVDLVQCQQRINKRCKEEKELFVKCITRILNSVSLKEEDRQNLLLKTLITSSDDLLTLFPSGKKDSLLHWWKEVSKPRIGFFTGVFDPLTNTHVEIIAHAIEQMVLDNVIVAPVYLVKKINRPSLHWQDRLSMLKSGLKDLPEVKVVGKEFEPIMIKGIETCFQNLRKQVQASWFHISGTDAFNRFKHLGFLDSYYLKENIRLFVVQRLGIPTSPPPNKYEKIITLFNPQHPVGIIGPYSARDIRQRVAGGKNIEGLVPENVKKIIEAQGFYSPCEKMQMPWKVMAPDFLFSLIKKHLPYVSLQASPVGSHLSIQENIRKLLENNPHSALAIKISEAPSGGQLVNIGYQQSYQHPLKLFEAECPVEKTHETTVTLINELLHFLLGHKQAVKQ